MTTWQDIAATRGFTDNGNWTWTAPNGQIVSRGFVAAMCRPELVEVEALALGLCPPSANEPRWANASRAAFPQVRRHVTPRCGYRRSIVVVKHAGRRRRSEAA